jgi:hypothetical protein
VKRIEEKGENIFPNWNRRGEVAVMVAELKT